MRRHPETTSQSEPEFWDGFSALGDVDAGHGRLQSDRHRICIGLKLCAENPRLCFANPHRLRPPVGALARSLQTLRVCLTLAPCIEFDSPRVEGIRPRGTRQAVIRSASRLYPVEALRGESAYLLRKSAPASAACRRPRPRAKNAYAFSLRPRPAQSSILRGICK